MADIDRVDAGTAFLDYEFFQPAAMMLNPSNGHAHYVYPLATPVVLSRDKKPASKAARLFTLVQRGVTRRLRADPAYVGLLLKNPLHERWDTRTIDRTFTLQELLGALDPSDFEFEPRRQTGLGRNCDLFENLRLWAYANVRHYAGRSDWDAAVASHAAYLNDFPVPLPVGQVRATARSVAKFAWENRASFRIGTRHVNRGALAFGPLPPMEVSNRTAAITERRRSAAGFATLVRQRAVRSKILEALSTLAAQDARPTPAAVARLAGVHRNTARAHLRKSAHFGAIVL